MLAIVDAAMADAMRSQTVRRGLEPADFTLFAYGGAAPLHAATLAAELGIRRVVVPTLAPVFSAFGAVASDVLHVLTLGVGAPVDEWAPIADGYRRLEEEAVHRLELDGVAPAGRTLVRSAQARFRGQLHAVQVPVAGGDFDLAAAARLREAFIARYERLFGAGTSSPEAGIEVTSLRLDAIGRTPRPELRRAIAASAPAPARPEGRREIWWHGRVWRALRYLGPLPVGSRLAGPAVIDHPGHTLVVPPGVGAHVDGLGNVVMEL
jgi:N-methylhydantoinase A